MKKLIDLPTLAFVIAAGATIVMIVRSQTALADCSSAHITCG